MNEERVKALIVEALSMYELKKKYIPDPIREAALISRDLRVLQWVMVAELAVALLPPLAVVGIDILENRCRSHWTYYLNRKAIEARPTVAGVSITSGLLLLMTGFMWVAIRFDIRF